MARKVSPKEKQESNDCFDNQYIIEKHGMFPDDEELEEDENQDYMDSPSEILNSYMPSED